MMKAVSTLLVVLVCCVMYSSQQICGRQLAHTRSLVCNGIHTMIKKDDKFALDGPIEGNMLGEDESSWPWLGRQLALATRWGRHKRGLVEECCFKQCTISEIQNYC